ncbi:monothiol glutaredoxin-S7 [Carex littledalei]|uniref:Monothiol glutaredoxin-S7 n=1 Tax=Carex littledalei TaxID=544730 RepID=A0A833RJ20_9POAL|nr:monothiol glutaredoxin-S7 [Carex littledalei]
MASTTTASARTPLRPSLPLCSSSPRNSFKISASALSSRSFPSLRSCAAPFSHAHRRSRPVSVRCSSGLSPELKSTLDKVVNSHKVLLFMKGNKDFPQCGFSHTVVQILKSLNVPFETLDVLSNEAFRQGLKEYSSWPTFPQLYIDGEFFGGCDITVEAYKSGELQELLEKTMLS